MNKEKLPLILISLLIALLLFFSVNDTFSSYFKQNDNLSTTTTWVRDIPIEVKYDKEKYYILGIPDKIDVKLTGTDSKIQKATTEKNFKARLDLSHIKVGDDQKVKVEITDIDKNISAVADPEFITVSVRERISREFKVIPKVKNERLLLGYSIKNLELLQPTVIISGAEETINSIYEVRAESNIKTKLSSSTKEEVNFVAYDRNFNKIEDIDIEKTSTTMTIELNIIEKTLDVKVNKIDKLNDNYAIENISIEPKTVIVRAENQEILNEIKEVFVDLELSSLTKEQTEISNLKVYANTNEKYVVDSPTVNITVKIKKTK